MTILERKWRIELDNDVWSIVCHELDYAQSFEPEQILDILDRHDLSAVEFVKKLRETIKVKTWYYYRRLQELEEITGKEFVVSQQIHIHNELKKRKRKGLTIVDNH